MASSHPPRDDEPSKAPASRSKKAVPRPFNLLAGSSRRTIAPRPQPRSIPTREHERPDQETRQDRSASVSSHGSPPPSSPSLQFITVNDPRELKSNKNRKLANIHVMREFAREKRQRFLRRTYSESQAAGVSRPPPSIEWEKGRQASVGWESAEDWTAPSTPSEFPPSTIFEWGGFGGTSVAENIHKGGPPSTSPSSVSGLDPIEDEILGPPVPPEYIRIPLAVGNTPDPDPLETYPVKTNSKTDTLIECFSFHCKRSDSAQPFAIFSSLLIPDRELLYSKSLLSVQGHSVRDYTFPILFRLASNDAPLFNMLLFLGEFGSKGRLTKDALEYQGNAIRLLNEKLRNVRKASDNATIATILFLSGFEYIKGNNRLTHEAHMKGLSALFKIRTERIRNRTESQDEQRLIERGLFWADLLGSVLLGSPRTFPATSFKTLRLSGTTKKSQTRLPPGFAKNGSFLTEEFIEIIKDIVDFQEIIESQRRNHATLTIEKLQTFNDRKASIEHRLASLNAPDAADSRFECTRLAIYLFSAATFPPMFGPPSLATVLSTKLEEALARVEQRKTCVEWESDPELLFWICFLGASRADPLPPFSLYQRILSLALWKLSLHCLPWEATARVLKTFLWSDAVLEERCKAIWETMIIPP